MKQKHKIKFKNQLAFKCVVVVFGMLVAFSARGQISSNSVSTILPDFMGDNVVVRNYHDTCEVISSYGVHAGQANDMDPFRGSRTHLFVRSLNSGTIKEVGKLPAGYYINDLRFITIFDAVSGEDVDFCVFCGRRDSIVESDWIVWEDGTTQLYTVYDTAGFVGFFYMREAMVASQIDSIRTRKVEWTKELVRLAAYTETPGHYHDFCNTSLASVIVMDVIGTSNNNLSYKSCFCRVKFYPECNNSTYWDNNIRSPQYNIERMVDICSTDDYIITVSKTIPNDYSRFWLRYNHKENYHIPNGLNLTNTVYEISMQNLSIDGVAANQSGTTHFIDSIYVCGLPENKCVVNFRISNQSDSDAYYNGIISILIELPEMSVLKGTYLKGDYLLRDAAGFNDTYTSVTLVYGVEGYMIHRINWDENNNWEASSITSIMDDVAEELSSIHTIRDVDGEECVIVGGYQPDIYPHVTRLLDQRISNIEFSRCYEINMTEVGSASIITQIKTSPFSIQERFWNNVIAYPNNKSHMTGDVENSQNTCLTK